MLIYQVQLKQARVSEFVIPIDTFDKEEKAIDFIKNRVDLNFLTKELYVKDINFDEENCIATMQIFDDESEEWIDWILTYEIYELK